ncbi:MFS transporter [Tsukamurella asaccharolytica]|uniref:Putative proline/betaine transporter n=1 Tax=Tsukamurella asaccharolytica TaxID=2592067 RepID=A0A5C5R6L4_9ACTN|nr:MFS transporter [Tsukamurella asaccharolytica]TWS18699.1 MFS transporter [Tsukamurella asaccharolytica]
MPDNSTTPGGSPLSRAELQEAEKQRKKSLHKAIGASAMGNFTEWFDYGVYASTAVYIAKALFPDHGTIGTLLGFAVSFILRPLGGFVWGPLGDKIGRKAVLAATILLMAGSTTLIAFLPTYDVAPWVGAALLVVLRMVQGFSTGGEYGGAATFMAEYSPDRHRGKYGSFLEFGTMCGFAGGTAVVLLLQVLLSEEQMQDFGWRIPFLMALPMGLIGWYLRNQIHDSPVFVEVKAEKKNQDSAVGGLKQLLREQWRPILILFGLVIALNVSNYTLIAYMPTYLHGAIGMDPETGSKVLLVAQVIMAALIPFFGALSDRTGRKPMWWISLIGLLVLAWPLFQLMKQGTVPAMLALIVLGVLYIPQLATITATFPAMFPTPVRFAGFAISYNVATAAFGGTAPYVNQAMIDASGRDLSPAWYMMAACVVGLIALPFLRETNGCSLRGTEVPGPDTEATRLARKEEAELASAS